jgi:hypothetical protein
VILAELPHAQTIDQAAQACAMTTVREALGIPANGLTRYRPRDLAALLWTAFSTSVLEPPASYGAEPAWIAPGTDDPRCVDAMLVPMRTGKLV